MIYFGPGPQALRPEQGCHPCGAAASISSKSWFMRSLPIKDRYTAVRLPPPAWTNLALSPSWLSFGNNGRLKLFFHTSSAAGRHDTVLSGREASSHTDYLGYMCFFLITSMFKIKLTHIPKKKKASGSLLARLCNV